MPSFPVSADNPDLLFSSSISVVVLGLMLFMSIRLYFSNRRQAYRTLLISLGFIFTHHLLQVALSVRLLPGTASLTFVGKLLQVFSFIVINFAVFELYYRRRPRTRLWFFGLLSAAFVIAAVDSLPDLTGAHAGWSDGIEWTPVLDGYLLALPPLFGLMFGPHVGQRRKYAAGLAAAFLAQLCTIAHKYWAPHSPEFGPVSEVLQVFYYVLLFMLLFERVVELLTSAYRSSITDGLTNLYNRRFFLSKLERALRLGKPVGVIFCDIDNFKRLNDTHGHHRADGVLKQTAAVIQEEIEGTGLAGRYGGEELVAFVSGPALTGIQLAESIRARVEKESLVTVSVGICVSMPGSGLTSDIVLKRADQAMYYSKKTGKNRVTDYAQMPDAGEIPFGPPSHRGKSEVR
jgi:diguanylate cyclase (GGDEF)-like protein